MTFELNEACESQVYTILHNGDSITFYDMKKHDMKEINTRNW